jgi:hypothetical protein
VIALAVPLMIALEASAMPTYSAEGLIAFNCWLNEVAMSRRADQLTIHQVGVLADIKNGSGTVLDTYDPDTVIRGVGFSKILLSPYPKNNDAYFFLVETPASNEQATLLVRPNSPSRVSQDKDFIGILAFKNRSKPSRIGQCAILRGQRATDLFREFHSEEGRQE